MELPSTIQDLVHRLEGKGEPMKGLPDLSGPEFQDFFPQHASISRITGWRSKVRLQVLEAIGKCNTFEYLNVEDIFGGDISRLTAREWDVVFRGFRSSTVLRMISVYHLKCNSDAEVETLETLCLQLGRILKSSSVTELKLYNCRLSARCFAKLASEVRGSSSKLQYLELEDAWEDSSAVKHVADIIESAPLLETLRLGGYYNVEEDETVGILSQALIKSSSLKELDLGGGVKWGAALLLKALAGDDGNRSIERVRLWRMDRIGDFLKELFSSSASLKEVELPHFRMRPEEVQQLGEVIRDNSIATTILAKFDAELFDWASIEALARSASSDVKDPTLELELYTTREDEVISSLNLLDRKVLENILINLDFCFKLEDSSQYFIPSFIPEHASKEEQNHGEGAHAKSMDWENRGDTPQFVGIRIQCKDERTMSLTAAFFPRFQMFMRRKLISEEMGASEENVICSRHYLRLFHDGHQIYIEHVQSEKYSTCVDVLMLCSSQTSKEKAITYVRKHIVQELISFCASPKGCPGVVLVFGLIQTFCVEMLIPIHLRTTILIEKLKLDFKNSINEKLEEMPVERSHLMEKEELFHYEHCWPPIRRYTGQISELARDLLWESDVDAVVNEIRQERIEELKSLQEGLLRVDNDLTKCYPEAENMVSYSNFPQMKDRKPSTSRYLSRASTSVENRSTRLLLFNIDPLEEKLVQKVDGLERKMIQKVDSLDERLRSVNNTLEKLEMKMGHILSVQQELQSTLIVFMSKVDRIIGYSQAFQQGNTPKRPYVTDDVGYLYRLSAGLHVGTIVRLHLMCESVTGFHFVKDQEGLKLRLDLDKWGLIRKTIEISYKVIYYAAKAALTKFCELGDAIPAWADLESDIVKLDVSSEDRKAVLTGGDSQELQDAWLRIQQILAPELQNRYSKIFKLYQVKYVSLEKAELNFKRKGVNLDGIDVKL
ncbi:hypothetical protein AXG93_3437s1190 [Marchantia polymorpha subsp. ruderalis]|uniref:Uncharacterized protein n=1 Tax=Marchantia polymorpha subsp. ruderalis TaxID=1480154 RepID=A0A176VZ55_MARPO|nr:hypothetical protein AXG93_3437s1190 [Marchantia polymorpha subsp. ruderalis]